MDRVFVANMLTSNNNHTIVNTVIEARIRTEVLDALAELGCDTAQGYTLTPALPGGTGSDVDRSVRAFRAVRR